MTKTFRKHKYKLLIIQIKHKILENIPFMYDFISIFIHISLLNVYKVLYVKKK